MRRVLDRSRQRRNANRLGWRSLLVNAAHLGWVASLTVQLVWHALGSQTYGNVVVPSMRPSECFTAWPVPAQCPLMVEQYIGFALLLGIICIWWNPKWQHKLEGREGRLVGLDKFYKLQVALLAFRFSLWVVCKDVPSLTNIRPSIHAVSLVLISMIAAWSRYGIVEIYAPRIVDWSQDPAPLLDSKQYVPPSAAHGISPPDSQQTMAVNVFDTSAPAPLQPWRPPTPPTDEDAMEWDPTPVAFAPTLKKMNYKTTEPSPFQGTLPAFPNSGIYRTSRTDTVEAPKAIGLPPGLFDKSHGKPLGGRSTDTSESYGLAQPKFFPLDARADTGLESIFDTIFSLKDETMTMGGNPGTRDRPGPDPYSQKSRPLWQRRETPHLRTRLLSAYRVTTTVTLTVLVLLSSVKSYFEAPLLQVDSRIDDLRLLLLIPGANLLVHLFTTYRGSACSHVNIVEIGKLVLESAGLLALAHTRPERQSLLAPLWDKLVVASLALLLFQEIYTFCIYESAQPQESPQISASDQVREIIPPVPMELPPVPQTPDFSSLRHSSSDESIGSTASAATSSTLSGWKTPVKNHRDELRHSSTSTAFGLNGLSLQNDNGFGIGNSVAGPRTRRAPAKRLQSNH